MADIASKLNPLFDGAVTDADRIARPGGGTVEESMVSAGIALAASRLGTGEQMGILGAQFATPQAGASVLLSGAGEPAGISVPAGASGASSSIWTGIAFPPEFTARFRGVTLRLKTAAAVSANFTSEKGLAPNAVRVVLFDGTVPSNTGMVARSEVVDAVLYRECLYTLPLAGAVPIQIGNQLVTGSVSTANAHSIKSISTGFVVETVPAGVTYTAADVMEAWRELQTRNGMGGVLGEMRARPFVGTTNGGAATAIGIVTASGFSGNNAYAGGSIALPADGRLAGGIIGASFIVEQSGAFTRSFVPRFRTLYAGGFRTVACYIIGDYMIDATRRIIVFRMKGGAESLQGDETDIVPHFAQSGASATAGVESWKLIEAQCWLTAQEATSYSSQQQQNIRLASLRARDAAIGRMNADLMSSTAVMALTFIAKNVVRRQLLHAEMPLSLDLNLAIPLTDHMTQVGGVAYSQTATGISFTGVNSDQIVTTSFGPTVPWFAVSAEVAFAGTSGSFDTLKIGIYKDANNWLLGQVNKATGVWNFSGRLTGASATVSATSTGAVANLQRIGMSMHGDRLALWAYDGKTWSVRARANLAPGQATTLDLTGWKYCVWAYQSVAGTQLVSTIRAGAVGGTGLRDHNFVTYEDGTPLRVNGLYYLTATIGSPGSNTNSSSAAANITAGHMGVFSYEPATDAIRQVGEILAYRQPQDGSAAAYVGDHAGKLVYDRTARCWHVLVSTWGDYTTAPNRVFIAYQKLDRSPLFGLTILRDLAIWTTTRGTALVAYDPELILIDGTWHLLYVRDFLGTNQHRRANSVAELAAAADVGLAPGCEGPKVRKIGGEHVILLASATEMQAWSLADVFIGTINLTYRASMGSNIAGGVPPHPNLIQLGEGARSTYRIVTFNSVRYDDAAGSSYFSHGDTVVYTTAQQPGVEYREMPI